MLLLILSLLYSFAICVFGCARYPPFRKQCQSLAGISFGRAGLTFVLPRTLLDETLQLRFIQIDIKGPKRLLRCIKERQPIFLLPMTPIHPRKEVVGERRP